MSHLKDHFERTIQRNPMNSIIYIVGLVVIILVILGFFGLR